MNTKDGGLAFPSPVQPNDWREGNLTVRDYFAAAALQGLMHNETRVSLVAHQVGLHPNAYIAQLAFELSDAMLAEREKVKR
jgi:hypothetical protein